MFRTTLLFLACATAITSLAAGDDSMFKSMDANGDGRISAAEHAASAKKMFGTMDINKDGKVTASEMDASHERITGKKAAPGELGSMEKIRVIDANGDGQLSEEEHAAGSQKMFDAMDTDKDGFLTAAEMSAGHAKMLGKPAK
jgi:Ca2+-binding EF-hand superfamily protein